MTLISNLWNKLVNWVFGPTPPTKPDWMNSKGDEVVIKYCEAEIEYYKSVYELNLRRWRRWQIITIAFGSIATVAAGIPLKEDSPYAWLRPIPAAITTIAAGLLAGFNYQPDALRQAITTYSLQGELAKYISGTQPYTGENRKNIFMNNIRDIIAAEQRNRRSQYDTKGQTNGDGRPPPSASSTADATHEVVSSHQLPSVEKRAAT